MLSAVNEVLLQL